MSSTLVSHAQNQEDVVLWRALRHLPTGRYLDVGANEPSTFSISRAFYDLGWSGVAVEPVPEFADAFRAARPRDVVVQKAVTRDGEGSVQMTAFAGTGLSTLDDSTAARHRGAGFEGERIEVEATTLQRIADEHLAGEDVHFCSIDVEGLEEQVIASADLTRLRPWVLVIESTAPLSREQRHGSWEPALLEAGYEFCLFDGLSRYYVAAEHAERLRADLSYPACPFDDYVPAATHALHRQVDALDAEVQQLRGDLVHWRSAVLRHWADAVAGPGGPAESDEAQRMRETLSWRVTAPLRGVRRVAGRFGR